MKKITGSIVALLIGIWTFISGIQSASQLNQAKSQGIPVSFRNSSLDPSIITSLITVVGLILVISAIAGLMKKDWSRKVSAGSVVILLLLQIFQGNTIMAIIMLIVGLLVWFL